MDYDRNVELVDVVLKRKNSEFTYQQLAELGVALVGDGHPDSIRPESMFSHSNTPWYGDYITIRCRRSFAEAIEALDQAGGNEFIELIRVEWPQSENGISVPYEPILYDAMDFNSETLEFIPIKLPIGIIL